VRNGEFRLKFNSHMVKQASRFSFFSHNHTVTVVESNVMARTLLESYDTTFITLFPGITSEKGGHSSRTLLVFSAFNNVTFHFAYETLLVNVLKFVCVINLSFQKIVD